MSVRRLGTRACTPWYVSAALPVLWLSGEISRQEPFSLGTILPSNGCRGTEDPWAAGHLLTDYLLALFFPTLSCDLAKRATVTDHVAVPELLVSGGSCRRCLADTGTESLPGCTWWCLPTFALTRRRTNRHLAAILALCFYFIPSTPAFPGPIGPTRQTATVFREPTFLPFFPVEM